MNIKVLLACVLLYAEILCNPPRIAIKYDHPIKSVMFSPKGTHLISLNETTQAKEQILHSYNISLEKSFHYKCSSPLITRKNFSAEGNQLTFPSIIQNRLAKTIKPEYAGLISINLDESSFPFDDWEPDNETLEGWKFFSYLSKNNQLYAYKKNLRVYYEDEWHLWLSDIFNHGDFQHLIIPSNNDRIAILFLRYSGFYARVYEFTELYTIYKQNNKTKPHYPQFLVNNYKTLLFDKYGKYIISAFKHTIKVGYKDHVLEGHTGFINALALSPSGNFLASASVDSTIIIWFLNEINDPLEYLSPHVDNKTLTLDDNSEVHHVAFSPNGKYLAGATSSGKIYVWDLQQDYIERCSHIFDNFEQAATWVSFSPDSQSLVASSIGGEICVWDLDTLLPFDNLAIN